MTRDDGILDRSRGRGYGIALAPLTSRASRAVRWVAGSRADKSLLPSAASQVRSASISGADGATRTPGGPSRRSCRTARPLRLLPRSRSLPGHRDHRALSPYYTRDHHRGLDIRRRREDSRQGTGSAPAAEDAARAKALDDLQWDPVRHEVHRQGVPRVSRFRIPTSISCTSAAGLASRVARRQSRRS